MSASVATRPIAAFLQTLVLIVACTAPRLLFGQSAGPAVDYERDVLPILKTHCLDCHGPDAAESDLRLDAAIEALRGGDSGEAVIVPGDASKSHLMERIESDDPKQRMPPDAEPLKGAEIGTLRMWINEKSAWAAAAETLSGETIDHWSFQPVVRPSLKETNGPRAVDYFIQRKLEASGLHFSKAASRERLVRRLYLIMHGLPPTWEQVQAFVNDERPDAWARLVNQTLDSPRYGERWATHWLDLVRFGETHGFETNRERPHAWHYRDWVIRSLNEDQPYDQFIRNQIAGDALGEPIGTGFLVAGPYDLVKGADPALRLVQRQDELADIINATGTAFLGLTTGCARCHNHKFDPITQTDYYALQAVFAGVQHADRPLPRSDDAEQERTKLAARIQQLRSQLSRYLPAPLLAQRIYDDAATPPAPGWVHLDRAAGEGKNPAGTDPGFAGDLGSENHSPNVSGGSYTWWKNQPGRDTAVCRLNAQGTHRVWLSWGAGFDTHTQDAQFLLDGDGDLSTREDQKLLATVNQQHRAHAGDDLPLAKKEIWSGFLDAGVHDLDGSQAVVLRAGETGQAITVDALLLQPVVDDSVTPPVKPPIRRPVAPDKNVEQFAVTDARFVRFSILRTSASQPCIDELEIYAQGQNIGRSDKGAKATSSGDFEHPLHKLEHINDGRYGNPRSWISAQATNGWVQIELPAVYGINQVVWGRDREKKYADRLALDYRIETSLDGKVWSVVASSADRLPYTGDTRPQPEPSYDFSKAHTPAEAESAKRDVASLTQLQARHRTLSAPALAYVGSFQQPGPTHRLYRGEPSSPKEVVAPGGIQSLSPPALELSAPEQQRRLAVADWIASQQNPLTPRVMVNRIWQHHFGVGIVDTPSDFGANGGLPSHPQLLDWLASELVQNGWSLKHIHRQILLSDAWQQDSSPRPEALRKDADSRLLWRFPPRRLEAEAIRDSMLAVSGDLNLEMGGPGFSGFEVQNENVRHYFPKKNYGPDDWRRMIYMTKVRQERDAVFGVFDCPDFSQVVPKRTRSTTPLQALNLLNSVFVLQQSQRFAQRLQRQAVTPEGRVQACYQIVYGREPDRDEAAAGVKFIALAGLPAFTRAVLNSNEFVFIP